MKATLILIIALCGAGCAVQPNYGAPFDANVHGTVEPEMSKLIVYRGDDQFPASLLFKNIFKLGKGSPSPPIAPWYYEVNIETDRTTLITRDGFIEQSLPAGERTVTVGSTSADVALWPGEVTYLQIGQEMMKIYVECDVQKDTARLCPRTRTNPTLAVVDAATALPQLAELKEICNDC